jgi:hypothetical protein
MIELRRPALRRRCRKRRQIREQITLPDRWRVGLSDFDGASETLDPELLALV